MVIIKHKIDLMPTVITSGQYYSSFDSLKILIFVFPIAQVLKCRLVLKLLIKYSVHNFQATFEI